MTPLSEIVKSLKGIPWGERDRWLAEMVVRMVEERAEKYVAINPLSPYTIRPGSSLPYNLDMALRDPDIDITPEDFAWLKGKVRG